MSEVDAKLVRKAREVAREAAVKCIAEECKLYASRPGMILKEEVARGLADVAQKAQRAARRAAMQAIAEDCGFAIGSGLRRAGVVMDERVIEDELARCVLAAIVALSTGMGVENFEDEAP